MFMRFCGQVHASQHQTNNLIYGKIKSHFKINPQYFGLHINHYTSEEDEYLESLEITNIIKKDQ